MAAETAIKLPASQIAAKIKKVSAMTKRKPHLSTIERVKTIRAITEKYYEKGNQAKCYSAVWRSIIYPRYKISYRTYWSYLNIPSPPPDPRQLELFP